MRSKQRRDDTRDLVLPSSPKENKLIHSVAVEGDVHGAPRAGRARRIATTSTTSALEGIIARGAAKKREDEWEMDARLRSH